ncbi:MAG TPA: DUF2182 domain-containing protein, partial [Gammaproteobacteria bacterium]|nr:DUF2182 domain-containing protein [Gammaproteobacteria bacterium]
PAAHHGGLAADSLRPWGLPEVLFALGMWGAMVLAMMLPAASPMVLAFSAAARRRQPARHFRLTGLFLLGYVGVWAGYSLLAVLAQTGLHAASAAAMPGAGQSPLLSGGLLFMAGIYQFTPLKHACRTRCRSPLAFLLGEWRPGGRGALVMGLRHGLDCTLCCWALMALMLVLGVMNLWWMLALTLFMLVEKLAPAPVWTGRIAGVLLLTWGLGLLLTP